MAATSANVVDLKAYRDARAKAAASHAPSTGPAAALAYPAQLQPMIIWVPMWTFFPVMAGPWAHAQ